MAIAFVQAARNGANTTVATFATSAFGANTTTGNAIIVAVAYSSAAVTVSSVTDTAGNIYSSVAALYRSSDTNILQIWHALNITGGASQVVTANLSGSANFWRIIAHEVSGITASNAFDKYAGTEDAGSATPTVGPVTTTTNGQYIFAAFFNEGVNTQTFSAGSGFTEPANSTGNAGDYEVMTEYQIQATAGSISAIAAKSGSSNNLMVMATFKAAELIALGSTVLDSGLNYITTNADKIYICSQQPTTYTEAITTYDVGYYDFGVGGVASAPAAVTTGGRKVVTNAVTGGTVSANGTPTHWAVVDSVNSLLLATGAMSGGVAVTTSDGWSLDALTIIRTGMLADGYDYNTSTNSWAAAVVASGGPLVSTSRKILVDNLIVGLKADGVWSKLDRLWLLAAANTQSALVDIKLGQFATTVNSPTFTADRGYAGNGTTSYIDSGFIPSSSGVNFVQDTACFFVWNNTAGVVANAIVGSDVANRSKLYPEHATNDTRLSINAIGATATGATGVTGNTGLWCVNRTAGSGTGCNQLYRNGSSIATTNNVSGALHTSAIYLFRDATIYTTRQASCFGVGGSLNATEQTALYNRLRTYMDAVGVA